MDYIEEEYIINKEGMIPEEINNLQDDGLSKKNVHQSSSG